MALSVNPERQEPPTSHAPARIVSESHVRNRLGEVARPPLDQQDGTDRCAAGDDAHHLDAIETRPRALHADNA